MPSNSEWEFREQIALQRIFPNAVTTEARQLAEQSQEKAQPPATPAVALQVDETKYPLHALWVEQDRTGKVLHYSVPNLAAVIPRYSKTDAEGRKRVSEHEITRNKSIPIFPPAIVSEAASFITKQRRPAITFSIPISSTGEIGPASIKETVVTSQALIPYKQVDQIIRDPDHQYHELFRDTATIAQLLLERRKNRGAIAVYDAMRLAATNEDGRLLPLPQDRATTGGLVINELAIYGNELAADKIGKNKLPAVFYNQDPADWARESIIANYQYVLSEGTHNEVLREGTRLSGVIYPGNYAAESKGHWGLALPDYVKMVNPTKRYTDMVNQRILLATMSSPHGSFYDREELAVLAERDNESALEHKAREKLWGRESSKKQKQPVASPSQPAQEPRQRQTRKEANELVSNMINQGHITDQLAQKIMDDLHKGRINVDRIAQILLTEPGDADNISNLQQRVMGWLAVNRQFAHQLLLRAESLAGWEKPVRRQLRNERGQPVTEASFPNGNEVVLEQGPAENAFFQLIRQRTGIVPNQAEIERAKKELEKQKKIAKQESWWSEPTFRYIKDGSTTRVIAVSLRGADKIIVSAIDTNQAEARKEALRKLSEELAARSSAT